MSPLTARADRSPAPLSVAAPAKLNLFLAITGRRPDGYHDLFSLFCPLSLADRIDLRFDTPGIDLRCDHPQVPDGPANLAWKAAERFFEAADQPPGVQLSLHKRIPVAAGLGGGSSDAAAVLAALNGAFDRPLSQNRLHRIAAGIGADVPFFLVGGPALATGVGDHLQPVAGLPHRWVILLTFPFAVPTAEVYKNLNLALTNCSKVTKSFTLTDGRMTGGFPRLCNDLETVTAVRYPEIERAKAHLLEEGAENALMSGSGPTVFGLFRNEARARQAQEALWGLEDWGVLSAELRV